MRSPLQSILNANGVDESDDLAGDLLERTNDAIESLADIDPISTAPILSIPIELGENELNEEEEVAVEVDVEGQSGVEPPGEITPLFSSVISSRSVELTKENTQETIEIETLDGTFTISAQVSESPDGQEYEIAAGDGQEVTVLGGDVQVETIEVELADPDSE